MASVNALFGAFKITRPFSNISTGLQTAYRNIQMESETMEKV